MGFGGDTCVSVTIGNKEYHTFAVILSMSPAEFSSRLDQGLFTAMSPEQHTWLGVLNSHEYFLFGCVVIDWLVPFLQCPRGSRHVLELHMQPGGIAASHDYILSTWRLVTFLTIRPIFR